MAPRENPIYRALVEVPSEFAEDIAGRLEEAEDPAAAAVALFERGQDRTEISAYYATKPCRETLLDLLRDAGDQALASLSIEPVGEKNWVAEAEALRPPVRAGRFLIHGAHDRGRVTRGACTIEVDAGLAFGTAHHATTKGCLLALDRLLKARTPRTVLDIGTGSGILAIAAAKAVAGATVLAGDNDPVSVAVAADNAKRNGVGARVRVVTAEGVAHPLLRDADADLLFANILLRPLLALAPDFARTVAPQGICVLSGLLASQSAQVIARYRSLGFVLEQRILLNGWATLVMSRRSEGQPRD